MVTRMNPEFWDRQHAKNGPRWTEPAVKRAAEIFNSQDPKTVHEFGFGRRSTGDHLSDCGWKGYDISPVAVDAAKHEGKDAVLSTCSDAVIGEGDYVCGIALLPNLSDEERTAFLDRVKIADRAVFYVKIHGSGPFSRGGFENYLRRWWPSVKIEKIGPGLLADCSHDDSDGPILTIGCSTYATTGCPDGFWGTMFTFASLMTHHGTFDGRVEYVLVDNHPKPTTEIEQAEVDDMEKIASAEGARYIRWAEKQGTYPGKNQLKVEARGKWVWTMDSHVLLPPHAIETALDWIEENPECDDLIQFANIFRSNNPNHYARPAASDFRKQNFIYLGNDHKDRGGVYGWTGNQMTAGEPFPIAAMITSCYLVRRDAWFSAKGYDPILGNYGGWEGPIQMKWWLMGRQVRSMRYRDQALIENHGPLHHWHQFNNLRRRFKSATDIVHRGKAKMRNFAASSAVIGGEWWVRRHCELKGWNFDAPQIQEGMREGLKLRPWMVENLAKPEWEDIREFFAWMQEQEIPGALSAW
jgi:hypothetical protein